MPEFDPGSWAGALVQALMNAFPMLIEAATNALATIVTDKGTDVWTQISQTLQQSDMNFVTRTPPSLSYNLGGVTDVYLDWRKATGGIVALAVVAAGLSTLGRIYFGWSWTLGTWSSRTFLGLAAATSMPLIYKLTIDLFNSIQDAIIGFQLPGPQEATLDPITSTVLLIIWVVLGFRLLIRMGYRLVYFLVLLAIGPLAAYCWVIPQARDFGQMWARAYVGMLVGQFLVTLCLKLSAAAVGAGMGGTIGGVAISIGVLLLAYDLATFAADIKGGGVMGVVKQAAAAVAVAF